jgi:hypothetical protein
VTGFQPTGNLKKSLIDLAYFDMFPRRSPTFFREEPFYRDAMAASKYAFDASRAQSVADFSKSARDLRLTCDGCHSTYQHKD